MLNNSNDLDQNTTIEQLLDTDEILTILCNPKNVLKFSQYFTTDRIKQLVDYAIIPPKELNEKEPLNIEQINITNIPSSKDSLSLFNLGYKYPYLSSEILSHDFIFIVEKILPRDTSFANISTYQDNILCESVADTSDNADNMIDDDIIDEPQPKTNFFNPPEIEYNTDKDISLNMSLDRKFNNTAGDFVQNLDIVDYIFNVFFNDINDINPVNGSYFVKIINSFIHTQHNKSNAFIKYICFRKKDIVKNIKNNIQCDPCRKILLEILLYDFSGEEENETNIKLSILTHFINLSKSDSCDEELFEEITEILCEYIDISKNCVDLFLTETIMNSLVSIFQEIKSNNKIYECLCVIFSTLIKEYKVEYDHNDKFLISLSKSHKNLTGDKEKDKTEILLNLECDNFLCNALNNCFENIQIFNVEAPSTTRIIHCLDFALEAIKVTRNTVMLENCKKGEFFKKSTEFFFSLKNDIYQNLYINFITIFIEDNNEQWLKAFVIDSGLLNRIIEMSPIEKTNSLFVHFAYILEMMNTQKIIANSENVVSEYSKHYSEYVEKMNTPLCGFRNTFLYMSNIKNESEGEIIDELDEKKKARSKSPFSGRGGNEDNDDLINGEVQLLLGVDDENENENFYYDNNFWQHPYSNVKLKNDELNLL